MTSSVGYADLARLLGELPVEDRADTAALLGFRRVTVLREPRIEPVIGPSAAAPAVVAAPAAHAGFLRVVAADERGPAAVAPAPPDRPALTAAELRSAPAAELPPSPELAAWAALRPRIHAALRATRPGHEPDVAALVRRYARGDSVARIPRRARRTWAAPAAVWIDRSSRLTPFWDDQDMVVHQLVRLCGTAGVAPRVLDASRQASLAAVYGDLVGHQPRDPSIPVLVLGDLGFYGTAADRACWLRTARRLGREGVRITALVPCPVSRWDRELAQAWNALAWEQASLLGERGSPEARAGALLRLVAPTALAQPGLVRALRRLLPAAEADASTEVDGWRHADVQVADISGLVLKADASERRRAEFAAEVSAQLQEQVSELITRWHGCWRAELIHAEMLAWRAHDVPAPGSRDVPPARRSAEAKAFAERVAATLCGDGSGGTERAMVKHYSRHLLAAVPDQVYEQVPALKQVWSVAFEDVADARLPGTIAPHELFVRTPQAPRRWAAYQRGEALVLTPALTGSAAMGRGLGSPVATFTAATPEVWVQRGDDARAVRTRLVPGAEVPLHRGERVALRSDCAEIALEVWERAPWTVAAGRDRHGLWAAFEVKGVQQRMRWIPPGRFLIGSPPSEVGRDDDEGAQHGVTITRGYWLGETPVTQALWRAVMTKNPSRFVSDDRPVETVSWDDCQAFIGRLNQRLEGLETRLPTEAEWERACRAGTTSATWIGDLTLRGENDAPELDAIAWYGGNSGVDFELDNGYDSSGWPGKQYPHTKAGTHPVGRKVPNPYGLHDMLGNVFEWCQDAAEDYRGHPYASEPAVDPVSPRQGRRRVYRGGSWSGNARFVRAASRVALQRGYRCDYLGFRLAGGQVSVPSKPGRPEREPRSGGPGRGAGHDTSRASARGVPTPRRNTEEPGRRRPAKKNDT